MPPTRRFLLGLVLITLGLAVGLPAADARPLISAPHQLTDQAHQPCVLYPCAGNPRPHADWQNQVVSLSTRYCEQFQCKPMDLVPSHGFDDNLFPFNPDWAYVLQTRPTSTTGAPPTNAPLQPVNALELCQGFLSLPPPCTSQPVSWDYPTGSTDSQVCQKGREPEGVGFRGHVNWEPATYEGTLSWESHASHVADDDYSLDLQTLKGDGSATGNKPSSIGIEFNSEETIDHFDSSLWWKGFHSAVDLNDRLAGITVNGHRAEVTGLVGLDTVHTVATESHPVYAMAIQTLLPRVRDQDQWAFFARNWGNQGYCSHRYHFLPRGPLTVRIPWGTRARGPGQPPEVASGVKIVRGDDAWTNLSSGGAMKLSAVRGEGALLTFDLSARADPPDGPLYWGTITLQWIYAPPSSTPAAQASSASVERSSGTATATRVDSDVEVLVERLWRRLPRRVRSVALALLPRPRLLQRKRRVTPRITSPPISPLRAVDSFVTPRLNRSIVATDRAQQKALCTAYKNRVPGFPRICRGVRRR